MFEAMQIDCETCPVKGLQCDECVVTALLTISPGEVPLDAVELRAVSVFAGAGLITAEEAGSAVARVEPGDGAVWASVG
jgi:hypothetical protein